MENCENKPHPKWKTRLVKGGFPDRSFDIEFWQEQGDEAIFEAAREMVELAEEAKPGRKPTLQKNVTRLLRVRPSPGASGSERKDSKCPARSS